MSICIFPEGMVSENESVLLEEFKDGAFRLAIEHQIPVVPMTFADNKKRFSYTFLSGSPGIMRVKMHRFYETKGFTQADKKVLKNKVHSDIYHQLLRFHKNC